MISSENLFKGSALFLAFFGLQFIFTPDLIMSEFFAEGAYPLNATHYWIMRGCGGSFLNTATFYWNTADVADKHMLPATVGWISTSILLPWWAHFNMDITPKHYIPFLGTVAFAVAHIYALVSAKGKGNMN